MNDKEEARSKSQSISWNDSASTGVFRVCLYSSFAYRFWRDYFTGLAQGKPDVWDAIFAGVTTLFIFTSAGWAIRKAIERRRQAETASD